MRSQTDNGNQKAVVTEAGNGVGTPYRNLDEVSDARIYGLLAECGVSQQTLDYFMSDFRFASAIPSVEELRSYLGSSLWRADYRVFEQLCLIEGCEGVPASHTFLAELGPEYLPSTSGSSSSRTSDGIETQVSKPTLIAQASVVDTDAPMAPTVAPCNTPDSMSQSTRIPFADLHMVCDEFERLYTYKPGIVLKERTQFEPSGPHSCFPIEDEGATDIVWPFGDLLPKVKNSEVSIDTKVLLPEVVCPIIDLDNKAVLKRIASYKKKVQTKLPKGEREDLVRKARDRKFLLKHDLTAYESQMFSVTHHLDEDAVTRIVDKVQECAQNVKVSVTHDTGPEVESLLTRTIEQLQKIIADATATTERFYDSVEDFGDSVRDNFNKFSNKLMHLFWLAPLCIACLYAAYKLVGPVKRVFSSAVNFVLSCVVPKDLWCEMGQFFSTEYETQFGGFDVKAVAHVLTLMMTYFTIGSKDPLGIAHGFVRSMSNYSRNVSGWKDLSAFVLDYVERFVNYVRTSFGCDRIKLYNIGQKKVDDWCSKVMAIANRSNTGGEIMTPEVIEELISLRHEGTILTNVYRTNADVSPALHKYLGYLDDICRTCSAAMHMTKGGRAPPTVMALVGKPGVGKTFLTQLITGCVLSSIIDADRAAELGYDFSSEVFQKDDSEYWNGYAGQKAFIKDDWGQSVPVPGANNDFITLIMANSSWAFPLNFADLENKGKNFFTSQFILLTTNIEKLDSCQAVIMEPEAVSRRIDFGFKIEVMPDFAIAGKLDMAKVESYRNAHGKFPVHAWVLHKHKFGVGSRAVTDYSKSYNLMEAIDMVKKHIKSNQSHFIENRDIVKRMVAEQYETQMNCGLGKQCLSDVYRKLTYGLDRVLDENRVYATYLSGSIVKTLATFAIGAISTFFVVSAIRHVCSFIFKSFSSLWSDGGKEVKNALNKKTNVPSGVLSQMIDAFKPGDFDVAVEGDNGLRVEKKFTANALYLAWQRMVGNVPQSNTPQGKFVQRQYIGTRVIDRQVASDVGSQMDAYGNSMIDIVYKNLYQMKMVNGDKKASLGQVLFVRDTTIIFPNHFLLELRAGIDSGQYREDFVIEFLCSDGRNKRTVTLGNFMSFKHKVDADKDLVAMVMPRTFRAHTDIVNKFVLDGDLGAMRKVNMRLETIEGDEGIIRRTRHMVADRKDHVVINSSGGQYTLVTGFEYHGMTNKGDCGGFVCLDDAPGNQCRRVFGIHVAGAPSRGVGVCNVVTQRDLASLLDGGVVTDIPVDTPVPDESYYNQGSFNFRKVSPVKHNLNPISSLSKTRLYGKWGDCLKRPAQLRRFKTPSGVFIDPMQRALEQYSTSVVQYDADFVRRAAYYAFKPFREQTRDRVRRIYDFEEACEGGPLLGFNGIPRNTSPGYPYCFEGHTNKTKFFGKEGPYDFTSEHCLQLKQKVDEIITAAKKGERLEHVFVDFLKDELRSEAKVQTGATRLISGSPLDYVVAFRMYFMGFLAAVQDTRILNGVAIGINPYSEWDLLSFRLRSKGNKCVAGDFKAFDATEQPDIHWALLDQINAWYDDGDENKLVRTVLWLEVVNSRHLGGIFGDNQAIYQWNKSLPSGHPATSVINSFYNLTLFNMCWMHIMPRNYETKFWEHVYACVYGDDNVLNIEDTVIGLFNQNTITVAMAHFGMTYTNENKEGQVDDYRPLTGVSFLKRGFRLENTVGRYFGPQDLDSLIYIPYWCRDYRMEGDILRANLEFVYTELSMHDPEVWETWATRIHAEAQEIGFDSEYQFNRQEYLRVAQDSSFIWPL